MVLGRFYFIQTQNRNLIGEFSNRGMDRTTTESADILEPMVEDAFIGTYRSTWDEVTDPDASTLDITYKPNSNNRLYTLKWRHNDAIIFHGEGFVVNNMLIGDYVDKIPKID